MNLSRQTPNQADCPERAENPGRKRLIKKRRMTLRDCKMLYKNGRPGWECGLGWTDSISKLSYEIECENQFFYGKFRIWAAADQIKEKFGELRFYYTVHRDIPSIPGFLRSTLEAGSKALLDNVDFRMKSVTVKPARTTITFTELSETAEIRRFGEETLVSPDGKFRCSVFERNEYEIQKRVPTRRKIVWHAARLCGKLASFVRGIYSIRRRRQEIAVECFESRLFDLVGKAEKECFGVCEDCGREIGTDYSPRCETRGWITYICENCAKNRGQQYIKGDAIYSADGEKISNVRKGAGRK